MKRGKVVSIVISIFYTFTVSATESGMTIHDMLAMKRVGHIEISHNGKYVAFDVTSNLEKDNKKESDLWLLELSSGDIRQLTHTPRSEESFQWKKNDEAIIFSRGKNIWSQPVNGTKAKILTTLPFDIDTFKLANDDVTFAFSSRVDIACKDNDCQHKTLSEKKSSSGRIYKQLFVRHWDRWEDGLRSHLFFSKLNAEAEVVDITSAWDADVPSVPFGGVEEYSFSSNSKQLYFTSRNVGRKEAWSTNFDVYKYDLQNDTTVTNLTKNNSAWDSLPQENHAGTQLAYVAMSTPGYESDKFNLIIMDLKTGERKNLTSNWDRSVIEFSFSDDDKFIFVTTQDVGNKNIYKIDLLKGKIKKLTRSGKNFAFKSRGKQLIFLHSDFKMPTEIFSMPVTGGKPQQRTFFNKPVLSKIKMGDYQQFSFKGWNGEKVYGYVVKPVDFKPQKKYPLTFLIHGGPQGSFYNQFHYRWNPQIYAAEGYVSVMIDFHGSTGYGQKFTDSIQNDWGGKPLTDLKKGLNAVSRKYKFIDTTNACALGASYGGYMINWIAGQWNDQFKCLVNHDGIFDNRMMYFSTEELWFPEREFKGTYYDKSANYEKYNPVNFVNFWKTPMFVIQGGQDYRIPESQSLGAFTALQRQNIPGQLLYFPDENHWVLKPANALKWHDEVLAWLRKYLK